MILCIKRINILLIIVLKNKIGKLIIGYNPGWKREVNIGKINNQKFVSIPYQDLINKLDYKSQKNGIELVLQEESYISKTDNLAFKTMIKKAKWLGKRIKRGLFKSSLNRLLNADVNGCIGIIRKVVGDRWLHLLIDRGCAFQPFKICLSNGF